MDAAAVQDCTASFLYSADARYAAPVGKRSWVRKEAEEEPELDQAKELLGGTGLGGTGGPLRMMKLSRTYHSVQ